MEADVKSECKGSQNARELGTKEMLTSSRGWPASNSIRTSHDSNPSHGQGWAHLSPDTISVLGFFIYIIFFDLAPHIYADYLDTPGYKMPFKNLWLCTSLSNVHFAISRLPQSRVLWNSILTPLYPLTATSQIQGAPSDRGVYSPSCWNGCSS